MSFLDNCIDALVGSHKYEKVHKACKEEMSYVMVNTIFDIEKSLVHLNRAGAHYRKLNYFLEKYPVLQMEKTEKELKKLTQDMGDFCKILGERC